MRRHIHLPFMTTSAIRAANASSPIHHGLAPAADELERTAQRRKLISLLPWSDGKVNRCVNDGSNLGKMVG